MKTIPDESVDIVITDPPYNKAANYLYGELAMGAAKILKPGGLLLTLTGHHSLDIILGDMTKYLDFYWAGGMPNTLGSTARYHPRQMMMGWKPCLWFSNGKPSKHAYVFDFYMPKSADKAHHPWGQPVEWFVYYINKITLPGDIVCDPFMGAGTTGVACARTGRNFIGIEIEEGAFKTAQERILEDV